VVQGVYPGWRDVHHGRYTRRVPCGYIASLLYPAIRTPVINTGYTHPVINTSYTHPVVYTGYTHPVINTGYPHPVINTGYPHPVPRFNTGRER